MSQLELDAQTKGTRFRLKDICRCMTFSEEKSKREKKEKTTHATAATDRMKSSECTPMRRQQFRLKSKYASRRNLNKYTLLFPLLKVRVLSPKRWLRKAYSLSLLANQKIASVSVNTDSPQDTQV